jgi:hypothetical protein
MPDNITNVKDKKKKKNQFLTGLAYSNTFCIAQECLPLS